jgi:hypothetical protein
MTGYNKVSGEMRCTLLTHRGRGNWISFDSASFSFYSFFAYESKKVAYEPMSVKISLEFDILKKGGDTTMLMLIPGQQVTALL